MWDKTCHHETKCQGASETERIKDLPKMIDSLFALLICIDKNCKVSLSTNGHFQPVPFPFLSNTMSLTTLICALSP
jgi:hypothetical protein